MFFEGDAFVSRLVRLNLASFLPLDILTSYLLLDSSNAMAPSAY